MPISYNNRMYEYLVLWLPTDDDPDEIASFDAEITDAGQYGWEAVSMNDNRVLLKREIV